MHSKMKLESQNMSTKIAQQLYGYGYPDHDTVWVMKEPRHINTDLLQCDNFNDFPPIYVSCSVHVWQGEPESESYVR